MESKLRKSSILRTVLTYFVYYGIPAPFIEPEMRIMHRLIKPNYTVFDIGANVGLYTALFSKLVGDLGQVHSFEPYSLTYNILRRNVKNMKLRNVRTYDVALGNCERNVSLEVPIVGKNTVNDPYVHVNLGKEGDIKMLTIDDFVAENNITKVDFLKIDVEGFEFFVLSGAQETIRSFSPAILIEIEQEWTSRYGKQKKEVDSLLKDDLGYSAYELANRRLKPVSITYSKKNNFFYFRNIGRYDKILFE